jgi:hypothetical protein
LYHIFCTIPFSPIYKFQVCFHLRQLQLSVDPLSNSPAVAMKYFRGE